MTAYKPTRPLPPTLYRAATSEAHAPGRHLCPPLTGVEVHDSSFGEWLDAGGDRRARPRTGPTTAADIAKRGQGRAPDAGWDALQAGTVRA